MYTRYDVRNACSRISKGLSPRLPELKEILQTKIAETNFNWAQFGKKWDIVVANGEINLITAIKDVDEVKEVCTKRQMIEEMGVEKKWNERENAVIDAMEAQFLDGLMEWANYKTQWSVKMDTDRGTVVTYLMNRKPTQIGQSEIDKKLKEMMRPTEETKPKEQFAVEFDFKDAKPLTEEDARKFQVDKEIKRLLDK